MGHNTTTITIYVLIMKKEPAISLPGWFSSKSDASLPQSKSTKTTVCSFIVTFIRLLYSSICTTYSSYLPTVDDAHHGRSTEPPPSFPNNRDRNRPILCVSLISSSLHQYTAPQSSFPSFPPPPPPSFSCYLQISHFDMFPPLPQLQQSQAPPSPS